MLVCIDIGGTSIKYGVASEDARNGIKFHQQCEIPTRAKEIKGPGIQKAVLQLVQEMKTQHAIKGVAISTAGMVDPTRGVILHANENIPEYTGINLKQSVETTFSIPCSVENDVNAAALGELFYGAAQGCESALCLTIGTGIGAAIILNGDIYRGLSLSAGEIGYTIVKGEMFENIASTSALVARLQAKLPDIPNLDGKLIFQEAHKGTSPYVEEIDEMCDTLAQGISNVVYVLNPQRIILGGGIMAQKDYLLPRIHKALQKYLTPYVFKHTELVAAQLSNNAGMAGAYAFWKKCQP